VRMVVWIEVGMMLQGWSAGKDEVWGQIGSLAICGIAVVCVIKRRETDGDLLADRAGGTAIRRC